MDMSGQLHAPTALPPGKETLVLIAGLDAVVKRRNSSPAGKRTPVIQLVA
jgi:hypothetical protein